MKNRTSRSRSQARFAGSYAEVSDSSARGDDSPTVDQTASFDAEDEANAAAITDRITDVLTEALPGRSGGEGLDGPAQTFSRSRLRSFGFTRSDEGQAAWNSAAEWPLTVVSIVFLVAYSWDVIGNLKGAANLAAEIVMWAVWAFFVVNYVANLVLAPRRLRWFFTHILEFLIVALPMLRPLRLLRLVMLWTVLQRTAGTAFRGRVATYVIGSASLLVLIAALGILDAEQNTPGASITNFGDALWWAFVTITTVGYGDYVPITGEGRLIAVGLMIAGIALLGVITATLASWLVDRVRSGEARVESANVDHIDALATQLEEMRAELARSHESFSEEIATLRRANLQKGPMSAARFNSRARRGAASRPSQPRGALRGSPGQPRRRP
ncbi:ion transporter [Subtercola sp. PAMC28395]|uniref:potassium channel family protein n=1 Tax=Subtercola sp. PAMC28395 TaxID=2846775 RepID=UPI001C0D50ED|nr:potassium channel family protein [Subtercola sp. PAMC28395]QWT23501.1 ion transporter [Subtercola sp. PAMC28395]